MKITSEQLRALQEREAKRTKGPQSGDGFTEVLTRQLDESGQSAPVMPENAPVVTQGLATISLSGTTEKTGSSAASHSEEAANQMDGMVTTFEQYASQMARNEGADLREAYSLLENMSGQIAGFKSRFPNAGEEMPELAAMLNEIDVLATTETFKFNRGDYL